jgi:type II secretory pathway pseudopilin PulG
MIRAQQQQLQQLQTMSGQNHGTPPVIDESTPTSEHSISFSNLNNSNVQPLAISTPRSPSTALHPRSSFDLARADLQQRRSRTPSRTASPRLRSTSISGEGGEVWNLGGRDESAFYQAETQMMTRENQMLRQRIRELGKSPN